MIQAKVIELTREQAEAMGATKFAALGIPTLAEMTDRRKTVFELVWRRQLGNRFFKIDRSA